MTREERNVLLFLAIGLLLGSFPLSPGTPAGEAGSGAQRADPAGGGAERAVPPQDPERSDPGLVDLFPIDVNRAPVALLEELPGIGPSRARAIVELRERRGGIRSVEELQEIRGIGPRTVERLRGLVTLADSPERAQGPSGQGEEQERRLVDVEARSAAGRERDR